MEFYDRYFEVRDKEGTTAELPKSTILITGGLGFIFRYVVRWFLMRGHEVHILDYCGDGSLDIEDKTTQGAQLHLGDVAEINNFRLPQFDYIIHAAAESNVDKSIENRRAFINSNIISTFHLLEWTIKNQKQLKQFLYVSTDEVYGSLPKGVAAHSGFAIRPSSPYAASKAAGGCLANSYRVTFGLPVKEIRMCNVIGRGQAKTKLVPKVIDCIRNNQPVPIYGDGTATREYLDVRTVGQGIETLFLRCVPGSMFCDGVDVYHMKSMCGDVSIKQMVAAIATILGKDFGTSVAERPGHDTRYAMHPGWLSCCLASIPLEETLQWIIADPKEQDGV